MIRSTTEIKRAAPSEVLLNLRDDSPGVSLEAAKKLILTAGSYGLGLRDYLRLAIDPRLAAEGAERNRFASNDNGGVVNGYEAALISLGLPTRDDLDGGITLQLAADTFNTYPGVRAFFPEVVDDMVKWTYRQTNFEKLSGIIAQSRTVNGPQMISTVVNDTAADYKDSTRAISEGGRIPIHSIKGSQSTIEFFKFGNGYKTSYEFARRVALDYLTPYAVRTQTEIEASKVALATAILVNGDGVNAAAGVIAQSSYDGASKAGVASTAGKLSWKHFTCWLVARAQAGVPIDTVVGNWDAYLQWLWLFEVQPAGGSFNDAQKMASVGFRPTGVPLLNGVVNFELSSAAPAGQLVGFAKGYTLEELVEANSLISESEASIQTQEVTYVKTENSGFRLVFGDTRSVFNYAA